MQLNFAILCQGAVPQGGLVTIVGAGADHFPLPHVPAAVNAAVVASFLMSPSDMKQPHTINVHFIDEDGRPIPGIEVPPLELAPHPKAMHLVEDRNFNAVINLNAVQLASEGRYAVDIMFDGRGVKRIPFRAALSNGGGAQPPDPGMPRFM